MNRLHQPLPHACTPMRRLASLALRRPAGRLLWAALLSGAVVWCGALPPTALAQPGAVASALGAPLEKYAGTYRISGWEALASRTLHHFFYLHPDGRFLLAGEWPGNEHSRFAGAWSVSGDRLYLNGQGEVNTNQGAWRAEFSRTFRIRVEGAEFVLNPEPAKNRYGLMGWPNAFRFYRRQPAPNLPGVALPADAAGMAQYIAKFLAAQERLPKK